MMALLSTRFRGRVCLFVVWFGFLMSVMFVPNLYAQIEITDSHGKYRFNEPPKRFVALNWALTEQLLELGEKPLGVAGRDEFSALSSRYSLSKDTVDLGSRLHPDLAKIRELKPEVIFIGYSQRSLIRPLSNIATVIYFKNFGNRYNNAEKSDERLRELAKLFAKESHADLLMASRDARLLEVKSKIKLAYPHQAAPKLVMLAPSARSDTMFAVFGRNSMPYYAATALGLKVVSPENVDGFGVAQMSLTKVLASTKSDEKSEVCVVLFEKYASSGLSVVVDDWLPDFSGCVLRLQYQQAFGGAMSRQWLAEGLAASILEMRGIP